jgi:uncharacterized protein YbaR (Trm112 family)
MAFDSKTVADLWCCSACRSSLFLSVKLPDQKETTKQDLLQNLSEQVVCSNEECRLSYPVMHDIPRLIVGDAQQLTHEQWQALRAEK